MFVKKRKSMVAFKIKVLLLSSKELSPYRRVSVISKRFLSNMFLLMFLMVFRKVDLSFKQWGQWRRKWVEGSIPLSQLQIGLSISWKPCLNLCSRRRLKRNLNLVSNLTPLRLGQLKTLLSEGRINFKRLFFKIFRLSELRIFRSILFHSMTAEKGISKKIMFYFELRNVVSIHCVISTHSNWNNGKKVFWKMTFINFIEGAQFPIPSSFFKSFQT